MSPSRHLPTPLRLRRPLPAALLACLLVLTAARANDRFFVPVGPSSGSSGSGSSSGGGGSSGSSGSSGDSGGSVGGGGGGGGSDSPGSHSGASDSGHNTGGGRFIVPMPGRPSGGGGGGGGGHDGGGGGDSWNGGDPYWGGCYYQGGRYHYWSGYGYPYSSTYAAYPVPYSDPFVMDGPVMFFPPEPPPLGTPLPEMPPARDHEFTAPIELSSYLTATFYPQLSQRLKRANLSARQLEEIAAYRAEREALLKEIRGRIAATRGLTPLQQARELERLSISQVDRLGTLETRAESLRTGLLRGGLIGALGNSGDWNHGRTWRLGTGQSPGREQTLGLEFRVMRAAVHFQEGLTPGQRGLLREVAMELQAEAYRPGAALALPAGDEALVFFSPATARVRFARDLPTHISARIDEYRKSKDALKAELRDVIYTRDSESRGARTAALRRLAAEQELRLQALDALADDIRNEFAILGRPLRSPPPPLPPPDLAARVAALRAERDLLQLELQNELARLREALRSPLPTEAAQAREELAAFKTTHQARYEAVARAQAALRRDLAAFFSSGPQPVTEASIDAMLNARDDTHTPAALWQRYTDYADAVFLAGLSPAQRQLLYDGALEQLGLPLPAGERAP